MNSENPSNQIDFGLRLNHSDFSNFSVCSGFSLKSLNPLICLACCFSNIYQIADVFERNSVFKLNTIVALKTFVMQARDERLNEIRCHALV